MLASTLFGCVIVSVCLSSITGEDCTYVENKNMALYGYNDRLVSEADVKQCKTACDNEKEFVCLSFDYMASQQWCFLSNNSRTTKPGSFGRHGSSDYYERVCLTEQGRCEEGWLKHDHSCYLLVSQAKQWEDAQQECGRLHGAVLATVESEQEWEFLTEQLEAANRYYSRIQYWLGGWQRQGQWLWYRGGNQFNPVTFAPWHIGEPNEWEGSKEDVIEADYRDGVWGFNDDNSSRSFPYICEKNLI